MPKNFRWCRWGAERRVKRAQTQERGPPSAPAVIYFFKIAVLTIIRLAVFNLLTVSLHISSYLSECLCLCGARLLILHLAPLPGDGLHLPRALLRLGAPIPFIACKPLVAIDTITTCISRKPIRTMLVQWT